MARGLLLTFIFLSGCTIAPLPRDIRSLPGGVEGVASARVVDVDEDGKPVIHRPEIPNSRAVSAGLGRLEGGADDTSVSRSGPGRGTMGGNRPAIIVGNEDGRPVIIR